MKKLLFYSVLLGTILLLFSSTMQAQTLWGETEPGMSPSQVQKKVEGSYYIKKGSTLYGGSVELLRIDDFKLFTHSFTVRFYFINKKLTQVTLSLNSEKSFSSNLGIFYQLEEALKLKYGKEISKEIEQGRASATWLNNRVNINLLARVGILNLNYQTTLIKEIEKL